MTALFNMLIAVAAVHVSPVAVHALPAEIVSVHEAAPVEVNPIVMHPIVVPATNVNSSTTDAPENPAVYNSRTAKDFWKFLVFLFGSIVGATAFCYAVIKRLSK